MIINFAQEFAIEECCSCGVKFAISKQLQDNFKKNKQVFYCPNGHRLSYTKSTAEILQEKLEIERQSVIDKIRQVDEKDMEITRLNNKIKRLSKKK